MKSDKKTVESELRLLRPQPQTPEEIEVCRFELAFGLLNNSKDGMLFWWGDFSFAVKMMESKMGRKLTEAETEHLKRCRKCEQLVD